MRELASASARASHSRGARLYSVHAEYLPVIKAKQRTAFPPNFIHSLDSAHMMLTAIACDKSGTRPRGVTPASSVCS